MVDETEPTVAKLFLDSTLEIDGDTYRLTFNNERDADNYLTLIQSLYPNDHHDFNVEPSTKKLILSKKKI